MDNDVMSKLVMKYIKIILYICDKPDYKTVIFSYEQLENKANFDFILCIMCSLLYIQNVPRIDCAVENVPRIPTVSFKGAIFIFYLFSILYLILNYST